MNLEFEKPLTDVEKKIAELRKLSESKGISFIAEIYELEKRSAMLKNEIYANLTPWQTVQVARHPDRPVLQDYIRLMFENFIELRGDRNAGDDRALIGGFATMDGQKVMLIGHNKGKTPQENAERNFGMANPEGYRKALRLMKLAEKYGLPVLSFVDTEGAFPGLEAEERGQPESIARNLLEMSKLEVPIISLVTGLGGSGGALGISVGDVLLMLSHSVYSVISPEGCATILWRDASFAPQAAEAMKITASELYRLGIVDEVIPEPPGGAHRDYTRTAVGIKMVLKKHLALLGKYSKAKLVARRFEKYSSMGKFALSGS